LKVVKVGRSFSDNTFSNALKMVNPSLFNQRNSSKSLDKTSASKFSSYTRYNSATEMVSYNTGSSYPILNRRKTSLGDKNAGDLVDWSDVNPQTSGSNRQYAIRAVVKRGRVISWGCF
jgi:hypothetical protein